MTAFLPDYATGAAKLSPPFSPSATTSAMHYAVVFVLLLCFVFGLGLLAQRLAIPYPILFVIRGLLIGFIPDLPTLRLDPDFIFFVFLPPLLYIQAYYTSWRDFRREMR